MNDDRVLDGVYVLITRPAHLAGNLLSTIRALRGFALIVPCMEITATDGSSKRQSILRNLCAYGLLIFISRNAVYYTFPLLDKLGMNILPGQKIIAVGKATADELAKHGCHAGYPQASMDTQGVLNIVKKIDFPPQSKVLIFKGESGNTNLSAGLVDMGFSVDCAEVYIRKCPPISLSLGVAIPLPDVILSTSAQSLKNLVAITRLSSRPVLLDIPVVLGASSMREEHRQLGFSRLPAIAKNPTDEEMLKALLLWRKRA